MKSIGATKVYYLSPDDRKNETRLVTLSERQVLALVVAAEAAGFGELTGSGFGALQ